MLECTRVTCVYVCVCMCFCTRIFVRMYVFDLCVCVGVCMGLCIGVRMGVWAKCMVLVIQLFLQNARSPMRIARMYFQTSIFISR